MDKIWERGRGGFLRIQRLRLVKIVVLWFCVPEPLEFAIIGIGAILIAIRLRKYLAKEF
jgi:hypothetical protein